MENMAESMGYSHLYVVSYQNIEKMNKKHKESIAVQNRE